MKLQDFGVPGGSRKTLVVLGAGASRGASFVTNQVGVLPPLDCDFFQQLSRMHTCESAARLLEFVRSEYGHESGLSMEVFFSEADYTDRFHEELSVDRGPKVKRYQAALSDFYVSLAQLLNVSTSSPCDYHERLASQLHAEDSIISFNYDCIVDSALRERAGRRWDPDRQGYGFQVTDGATQWSHSSRGRAPQSSIRLLKMHGSANWNIESGSVSLLPHPAEDTLANRIIPPTWFKNLQISPFTEVWKRARLAVRSARIIVVVGYSVPPTDLFSRSLFKVEAGSKEKREKLDLLVLVNPDSASRQTFTNLVKGALEPRTRILEYATLQELDEVLLTNSPNP